MQLTIVGAGPSYTDRVGAASSSYLLSAGRARLLLDLGQGSFPGLASTVEPSELQAVVISHLHPDHFVDLVPLRHYLRYEFDPPRRVRVLAPSALTARLDSLLGEPGFAASALDVEPLTAGERTVGPFLLEAVHVAHTDESYAFRVSTGVLERGLVYSGDCGDASGLLPLIRAGDTLLAEVSFGPGPVPPGVPHLDARAAAGAAATAGADRLLLTHLQMGLDAGATLAVAREIFGGDVRLVIEGETFSI